MMMMMMMVMLMTNSHIGLVLLGISFYFIEESKHAGIFAIFSLMFYGNLTSLIR